MKIRRLPEIDLARFATISERPKLKEALWKFNQGGNPWSYDPVRSSTAEILGSVTPLYGKLRPTVWSEVRTQIKNLCRPIQDQIAANIEVGGALFDYGKEKNWSSANFDMGWLPINFDFSIRYWIDLVVEDNEGVFIPFFDHRRGGGISNSLSRQIVFSMQNVWVRERHPDLANARLAVVRFPTRKSARSVSVEFHKDTDLLSYEELDRRVRTVYEVWAEVLEEKSAVMKKTGTDGGNPFGF